MQLAHLRNLTAEHLGDSYLEFISHLEGPSVLHLDGEDPSRCRVLVTLLHANEPSGFKAVHRLLKEQYVPHTNCKIIIASVVAARTAPLFTHRMLPGMRDLNRCFGKHDETSTELDKQRMLANGICEVLSSTQAEAIIDLHNTSGSGPAFCVSIADQPTHQALAGLFQPLLIKTDIRLGAIMERDFGCPIITVEAGGSKDAAADDIAYQGIKRFFSAPELFMPQPTIEIIRNPRRLEVKPEVSIGFDNMPNEVHHLTMRNDIEKLNFGLTQPDLPLGWVNHGDLNLFQLDDPEDALQDYFYIQQGKLYTRQALKLFMVTTRPDIAKSDCLFYFALSD